MSNCLIAFSRASDNDLKSPSPSSLSSSSSGYEFHVLHLYRLDNSAEDVVVDGCCIHTHTYTHVSSFLNIACIPSSIVRPLSRHICVHHYDTYTMYQLTFIMCTKLYVLLYHSALCGEPRQCITGRFSVRKYWLLQLTTHDQLPWSSTPWFRVVWCKENRPTNICVLLIRKCETNRSLSHCTWRWRFHVGVVILIKRGEDKKH